MRLSSLTRNPLILTPVFMLLAAMAFYLCDYAQRLDPRTVLDLLWKAAVLILLLRLNFPRKP